MAASRDSVDWRALAGFAMTRLGWTPQAFWAATPADLRCALEALKPDPAAPASMGREEFAALARRFPDAPVDRPARPRR